MHSVLRSRCAPSIDSCDSFFFGASLSLSILIVIFDIYYGFIMACFRRVSFKWDNLFVHFFLAFLMPRLFQAINILGFCCSMPFEQFTNEYSSYVFESDRGTNRANFSMENYCAEAWIIFTVKTNNKRFGPTFRCLNTDVSKFQRKNKRFRLFIHIKNKKFLKKSFWPT